MVPPVQHASAVEVLESITKKNSAVKEGRREEATAFGGGGGKDGDLKVIQCLQAHPRDGPTL